MDMKGAGRNAIFKVIRMMPSREAYAAASKANNQAALKRLTATRFLLPKLTLLQVVIRYKLHIVGLIAHCE